MEGGIATDYDRYRRIIKAYIEKNPQRDFYVAAGWVENEEHVTKAFSFLSNFWGAPHPLPSLGSRFKMKLF